MTIDETLINYELCVDNKYLKLYRELLEKNLDTKDTIGKHLHHSIPCAYYEKLEGLEPSADHRALGLAKAEADENNFGVYLSKQDHIRAHCYLALSSNKAWFTYANIKATQLLGSATSDPELCLADISNTGKVVIRCWVHNDTTNKQISRSSLDAYLAEGWVKGYSKMIAREKTHKADIDRGKGTWLHKGAVNKIVYADEMHKHLKDGWRFGRCGTINTRKTFIVNNGQEQKRIKSSELTDYLFNGWEYGKLKK